MEGVKDMPNDVLETTAYTLFLLIFPDARQIPRSSSSKLEAIMQAALSEQSSNLAECVWVGRPPEDYFARSVSE